MGTEFGGSIEFEYTGVADSVQRDTLATLALADWRRFVGDPEAALPWNTSFKVQVHEAVFEAVVSVRWERVSL